MSRGKPVENPDLPYSPNRVQLTTMVSPKVREMLKRIKVENDLSYGQAICEAVESYWAAYASENDKKQV